MSLALLVGASDVGFENTERLVVFAAGPAVSDVIRIRDQVLTWVQSALGPEILD